MTDINIHTCKYSYSFHFSLIFNHHIFNFTSIFNYRNFQLFHSTFNLKKVLHCKITVLIPFLLSDASKVREVRCYCNKPECVPQGYMCRGRICFTELPSSANSQFLRAEHSGCLDERSKNRQCPAGLICCDQDLCNHVDNPAMRNRLNKTLREGSKFFLSLCDSCSSTFRSSYLSCFDHCNITS